MVVPIFSLLHSIPLYEYIIFIYYTLDRQVSCFQFGSIMNNAALNILLVYVNSKLGVFFEGKFVICGFLSDYSISSISVKISH